MVLGEKKRRKKKERKKKNFLFNNIKTLVGSTIQRKWPEKSPGALRQRKKIDKRAGHERVKG